jgi:hypothetical protein
MTPMITMTTTTSRTAKSSDVRTARDPLVQASGGPVLDGGRARGEGPLKEKNCLDQGEVSGSHVCVRILCTSRLVTSTSLRGLGRVVEYSLYLSYRIAAAVIFHLRASGVFT